MSDNSLPSPAQEDIRVKQPLSTNRLITAGSVAGSYAIGPQILQPVIEYAFQIMSWTWPGIPVPALPAQFAIANVLLATLAFFMIIFFRSHETLTQLERRKEDVQKEVTGAMEATSQSRPLGEP